MKQQNLTIELILNDLESEKTIAQNRIIELLNYVAETELKNWTDYKELENDKALDALENELYDYDFVSYIEYKQITERYYFILTLLSQWIKGDN